MSIKTNNHKKEYICSRRLHSVRQDMKINQNALYLISNYKKKGENKVGENLARMSLD